MAKKFTYTTQASTSWPYPKRWWTVLVTAAFALAFFGFFLMPKEQSGLPHNDGVVKNAELNLQSESSLLDSFIDAESRIYDEIGRGETLYAALRRLDLSSASAEAFVRALSSKINMRLIKPNDVIVLENKSRTIQLSDLSSGLFRDKRQPDAIEIFSKDENGIAFKVRAERQGELSSQEIIAETFKSRAEKELSLLSGRVDNSVYSSILSVGGDGGLVTTFTDIFAWQFDFFRDTKNGDAFQMIVEKVLIDGRVAAYGKVLAAEYANQNKTYRAYAFSSGDGRVSGFFDEKGQSLKNAFLKAPLKLVNITSKFNKKRFHPVQKRVKPHNGIDYGAHIMTPIMAVAGGTVSNAGFSRFNGNFVKVRHMNGYETEYLHAHKLAKGIRVGAHVSQGQVIAFVGKTGLATGPHLHFGMKKNGSYVDPQRQVFAREAGVPSAYMREFAKSIEAMAIAFNSNNKDRPAVVAINENKNNENKKF